MNLRVKDILTKDELNVINSLNKNIRRSLLKTQINYYSREIDKVIEDAIKRHHKKELITR